MEIGELTNAEILYHSDLKNKVLASIPHTPFHILCVYGKATDTWDMYLIELISSKRKVIGRNMPQEQVAIILSRALREEDPADEWNSVDEDEGVEAVL